MLSKQLLPSGTSIGANIEEAGAAQSKKDFAAKIAIAAKEARETHYWLRLVRDSNYLDMKLAGKLLSQTMTKPHSADLWAVSPQGATPMASRRNAADGRPEARPKGASHRSRIKARLAGNGPVLSKSRNAEPGPVGRSEWGFVIVWLSK